MKLFSFYQAVSRHDGIGSMAVEKPPGAGRERIADLWAPGRDRRLTVLIWICGIIATLFFLWALHITVWVSMPLMAAFFISIAVWPVAEAVRRRLPTWLEWLGYVAAMAVIVFVLAFFFWGVWYAASQVASQWPKYDDRLQQWLEGVSSWLSSIGYGVASAVDGQNFGGKETEAAGPLWFVGRFALTIVDSIWRMFAGLLLILFLVLLMLIEAHTWRAKVKDWTDGNHTAYIDVVGDVATRFRAYIFVRTMTGLITAGLYAFWLWVWDIDFVVVWALLAFLLNFVPNLGSLVAGGLATGFAFIQQDVVAAAAVGVGLLVIEQVMGNYLDPLMQGRKLSLSPLVVLVMLLLWGWVWGLAGALLAAPMTVLVVMTFARIPALAPVALALSSEKTLSDLSRRITR